MGLNWQWESATTGAYVFHTKLNKKDKKNACGMYSYSMLLNVPFQCSVKMELKSRRREGTNNELLWKSTRE